MASARLQLLLDDSRRVYAPGDAVEGRVQVTVDGPVESEGLFVSVAWRTAGKCNPVKGNTVEFALDGGRRPWTPGERIAYAFSTAVPPGPPTYEGKNLQVEWFVRARAAIPWAKDPEDLQVIEVAAPPAGHGDLVEKASAGGFEIGCAATCGGIFLLCLAVIVLSVGFPGVGWFIVGGIAGLVALFMTPIAMGYRKTGPVRLEVGPSPVEPGGEIAVRLTAVPRKEFTPKRVKAELRGKEVSVKGSGKSRTTRTVDLARVRTVLTGPSKATAGREAVWAGLIEVPSDAPPSFETDPHKVVWTVEATVELDWVPDPDWEVEVKVG